VVREQRLYDSDTARALTSLADRDINYAPMAGRSPTRDAGWHVDTVRHGLATEAPGSPVEGGPWELACRLVHDYQFAEPGIIRALYHGEQQLLGRNMLLEGRFFGLRFDMGVRVTSVIDETRGAGDTAQRVWGWGYQTLQGHLEQGELVYEVIKHVSTGNVEFVITGYSRRAQIANPLVRLGFTMFGRMTQHRFYHACGRRLRKLVHAELDGATPLLPETVPANDTLIVAPAHAGPENWGRATDTPLPARLRGHGVLGRKLRRESR